TSYRMWLVDYTASFVISIISLTLTILLLAVQTISSHVNPNGIIAAFSSYIQLYDPFFSDTRRTKLWLRSQRVIFSLLSLIGIIAITYITTNCFLIEVIGTLIGFFIALGATILVYISLVCAFREIRKTRNLTQKNNLVVELNELKKQLPLELINKLNSEMKLTEEQKNKLKQEIKGKVFIFYTLVIGIINFPFLDSETKINVKNGFYTLLFGTDYSLEIYRVQLDVIFSDILEKLDLNRKKSLIEYLLTCLNNIRLNESFNMNYLNSYSMMFYLLKEYMDTKFLPVSV
ncbi:MAG: hypothetical protein ACFFDW_17660, partial [Candidatus Thorarchaeota archaeon]